MGMGKKELLRIRSFIKVRSFLISEVIILGILLITSNIIYGSLFNNIRKDVTQHRVDIMNTQNDIIETEAIFFEIVFNESGSIITDSVSYEDYAKVIEKYKKVMGGDKHIDSLLDRKLEIKKEYMNISYRNVSPDKIITSFSKKLIIGNPEKYLEIDSDQYEKEVLNNTRKLISDKHNLLKENTDIDRIVLSYINTNIYLMIVESNHEIDSLNNIIMKDINRMRNISIIHSIITLLVLFIITLDIKKMIEREKRRKSVIDMMIRRKKRNNP